MDKANRVRARLQCMPLSLGRSSAPLDQELQRRADHAAEVMALLGQAERLGLSERKARVLRERLTRQDIDARTLGVARLDGLAFDASGRERRQAPPASGRRGEAELIVASLVYRPLPYRVSSRARLDPLPRRRP